jgi:hypothetical protein
VAVRQRRCAPAGQIALGAALKPREDGGYSLSAEAMQRQLEFFLGNGPNP